MTVRGLSFALWLVCFFWSPQAQRPHVDLDRLNLAGIHEMNVVVEDPVTTRFVAVSRKTRYESQRLGPSLMDR